MVRSSVLVVLFCAALAGCLPSPAPSPTVAVPASPTAGSTSAPPPQPSTSRPGPSEPGTPSVPPASGAIDVAKHASADFASPSGRIWCGLHADVALCHFPFGDYQGKIPDSEDVCPGVGLDVTGVQVTAAGSDYFCSGDPSAWPVHGSTQVAWQKDTGFPFVKFDGQTLATLPYGRALSHGRYLCASETNGVTCADTRSGHGFRVARAGVVLF